MVLKEKKEAPLIHNLILHIKKNANTMNEIFATLFQGNNSNSDTLLVAKLLSWNYSLYMYIKEVYLCTLIWKKNIVSN